MENFKKDGRRLSASFVTGAVALVFLIIGYQSALFIHKASVAKIIADRDEPDTVFIVGGSAPGDGNPRERYDASGEFRGNPQGTSGGGAASRNHPAERAGRAGSSGKHLQESGGGGAQARSGRTAPADTLVGSAAHSEEARQMYRAAKYRKKESFVFDPNTVSIDGLMRLGFSEKQAESIDNYRKKGGRFRRKEDFAKSYVVADSVYRRLEPYISIPLLDINAADSAAFETLPGIGRYFAARMVSYREELGGYSFKEQLMDIPHFDGEKFAGLEDLITVGTGGYGPFRLWSATEKELEAHPYIDRPAAHSIVLFRENSPVEELTVENLVKAGILDEEAGRKLGRCRISGPGE
ncbi:MAG: ComEA family DNA-binding protein [Candidatus Cryptobacteroides sp.]